MISRHSGASSYINFCPPPSPQVLSVYDAASPSSIMIICDRFELQDFALSLVDLKAPTCWSFPASDVECAKLRRARSSA